MRALSWAMRLGIAASVAVLGACQPVSEPWDGRDYFAQERQRSIEQETALRNRLAHSQGESQFGAHALQ